MPNAKLGRPPLKKPCKKVVGIYVTEDFYQKLKRKADSLEPPLNVSTFARHLLEKQVR